MLAYPLKPTTSRVTDTAAEIDDASRCFGLEAHDVNHYYLTSKKSVGNLLAIVEALWCNQVWGLRHRSLLLRLQATICVAKTYPRYVPEIIR